MLAVGRRCYGAPPGGLLSGPLPADQYERPGDYGSYANADAIVDRGSHFFRRCFAIPPTSSLGAE
jgi:hypothetical protein